MDQWTGQNVAAHAADLSPAGHAAGRWDCARRGAAGISTPARARSRAHAPRQSRDRRQRVPRARSAGVVARVRGPRHFRVREARWRQRSLRVARQDVGGGTEFERHDRPGPRTRNGESEGKHIIVVHAATSFVHRTSVPATTLLGRSASEPAGRPATRLSPMCRSWAGSSSDGAASSSPGAAPVLIRNLLLHPPHRG